MVDTKVGKEKTVSSKHLIVSENKEVLKNWWGHKSHLEEGTTGQILVNLSIKINNRNGL